MNSSLSTESTNIISQVAQKYGISEMAVSELSYSLIRNGCSMAQFNISELGGSGQWMRGGMTMVGDMFNNNLKALVNNICNELANLISQGAIQHAPTSKTQESVSSQYQGQGMGMEMGSFSSFSNNNWWGDLGQPISTGSQNNMSYAIFNDKRRLAIQLNGKVIVFDTLDHQIGGVGQQQGGTYSVSFTSQKGNVNLDSLPVVSTESEEVEVPKKEAPIPAAKKPEPEEVYVPVIPVQKIVAPQKEIVSTTPAKTAETEEDDIFNKIEKLAKLKEKGILTDEEFSNKKTELLARL